MIIRSSQPANPRPYTKMRLLLLLGLSFSLVPCGVSLLASPMRRAAFPSLSNNNNAYCPLLTKSSRSRRITTTTQRRMVFTPPDTFEQFSTSDMIDKILDECLRTSARRPIMVQFNPASNKFIWRQWKGTVLSETWKSGVRHVIWTILVYCVFWKYPTIQQSFDGFSSLWGQLLSVTTFSLTFYLNASYSIWRKCLTTCRMLQGRLNDLVMALAGFAQRVDSKDGSSEFTPPSRKILVGAYYLLL